MTGSATPKNIRPMPMPAEKSMANGQGAVVRFAVIRAELDVAVATEGQQHHHQQDECDGENVQPADIGDDRAWASPNRACACS